jgi:hypothetical protein
MQNATESDDPGYALELLENAPSDVVLAYIRVLVSSESDYAAEQGAWLLHELGSQATSLLDLAEPLVSHKDWRVRYLTIDFLVSACQYGAELQALRFGARLMIDKQIEVAATAIHQFSRLPEFAINLMLEELQREGALREDIVYLIQIARSPKAGHDDLVKRAESGDSVSEHLLARLKATGQI